MDDLSLPDIAQFATSSGFATLTWYLLAKWIPSERQSFQKQLTEQQERFDTHLREQHIRFEGLIENEKEHFRTLLMHITTEFRGELHRMEDRLNDHTDRDWETPHHF